nr:hypothetical protein [Mycobacterium lepromatosis]
MLTDALPAAALASQQAQRPSRRRHPRHEPWPASPDCRARHPRWRWSQLTAAHLGANAAVITYRGASYTDHHPGIACEDGDVDQRYANQPATQLHSAGLGRQVAGNSCCRNGCPGCSKQCAAGSGQIISRAIRAQSVSHNLHHSDALQQRIELQQQHI